MDPQIVMSCHIPAILEVDGGFNKEAAAWTSASIALLTYSGDRIWKYFAEERRRKLSAYFQATVLSQVLRRATDSLEPLKQLAERQDEGKIPMPKEGLEIAKFRHVDEIAEELKRPEDLLERTAIQLLKVITYGRRFNDEMVASWSPEHNGCVTTAGIGILGSLLGAIGELQASFQQITYLPPSEQHWYVD